MRNLEISDELYERLKDFVVDPFDDTAELVIARLVQIANKAKDRWPALEGCEKPPGPTGSMAERTRISNEEPQGTEQTPVLL